MSELNFFKVELHPLHTIGQLLPRISQSLSHAKNLEELTRPLLELLEHFSGLESTYLTQIDSKNGIQHVQFSHNSKTLIIPEGLSVPWDDTLCKRALAEECSYTNDVAGRWGDSDASRQLGIKTYASTPVRTSDGNLYGTLCGASAEGRPLSDEALNVFHMFSMLLAQFVERDRLVQDLQQVNAQLSSMALTDWLTGIPNRRALTIDLERLLSHARRARVWVLVAFIDLDGFKAINDKHGHEVGDQFLQAMAQRLKCCSRAGDILGRLGGDEFIIAGEGPPLSQTECDVDGRMRQRISEATAGKIELAGVALNYPGASIGVVRLDPHHTTPDSALQEADRAMYLDKKKRRSNLQEDRKTLPSG